MSTTPHLAAHPARSSGGRRSRDAHDARSARCAGHAPAGRRTLAALLAVMTLLALTACDLRRETATPTEPVPGTAELVRRDAVDDALALAAAASAAGPGADETVAAVLGTVATTAGTHVTALGGVYDSGLPDAAPSPTTTTTTTSTPAEVLTLLDAGTTDARSGAIDAPDGGLARVLAAVAASRAQLAAQLATALGVETPTVDTTLPEASSTAGGSGDGSTTTPAVSGTTPTASGSDLTRTALLELIAAEDQAGYGFEVAAARLADTDRETTQAAAEQHRAQASQWAEQAGVTGSTDDPRRVTYALGADLSSTATVRTFCGTLETSLTDAYADAVVSSTAGTDDRAVVVDALREAAVAALAWGAEPTALPGVPDSTAS